MQLATVGGKAAASIPNGIENVVTFMATSLIVPTLPTFTGTSGSMATNGLITFNNCTVISVDAAFPTTFRRHMINLQTLNGPGIATFNLRTAAPADDVAAKYDRTESLSRNATVSSNTTPSQTSWSFIPIAQTLVDSEMVLNGVALAQPTTGFQRIVMHANPAVQNVSNGLDLFGITHQLSNAYAGFKITFASACSGTIRIIGEY